MPSITDWLMVIITFVYVIATIIICVFNYKTIKVSREQLDEMMLATGLFSHGAVELI